MKAFRLQRKGTQTALAEWETDLPPSVVVLPDGNHVCGINRAPMDLGDFEIVEFVKPDRVLPKTIEQRLTEVEAAIAELKTLKGASL